MASNNLAGYNDLVECPYNKAHQIMRSRLQFHLVRCRRSHPNSEKVTCPFNTTHIMNKEELDLHTEHCSDRASLERYRYALTTEAQQVEKTEQPRPNPRPVDPSEESWDDIDVPSYDPKKYAENAPVLRDINVEPRAQREAFRRAERERLNRMNF